MTNKQQIWHERKVFVLDFLKSSIPGFVVIFVALVVLGISNTLSSNWDSEMSMRMAEVNSLNEDLTKNVARMQAASDAAKYAQSGIDSKRVAQDTAIITEFFETYGTWSDAAERVSLQREAGSAYTNNMDAGWWMLYPSVTTGGKYLLDWDGRTRLCKADDPASQTFVSLEVYAVANASNTYQYYGRLSCERQLGDANRDFVAFISFKIDSSGMLSDLSGALITDERGMR